MINTIGKNIHTFGNIKENTPRCQKIRQECGFTQKVAFYYISLCFLPHSCCANIGREVPRLHSCFQIHTKKYMTPIHALLFKKLVKMCVNIRHIKKPV